MFGFFKKKKTKLEQLIADKGVIHAANEVADIISGMIKYRNIAKQFVLEEVEAAFQGNQHAIDFANKSGFLEKEYKGAMRNSIPEIEGEDGPQQFLLSLCSQLHPDIDLVVKFRISVVDKIMKNFHLGRYDDNDPELDNVIAELSLLMKNPKVRDALESAQLHGMVGIDQVGYIQQVNDLVNRLAKMTDKTPEEIVSMFS